MNDHRRDRLFDRYGSWLPGSAEYETVHRRAGASLRYYAPATRQTSRLASTPLVVVPPLGVDPRIYDQRHGQSLIAYFSARGFDLYLIDWGRPTRSDDRRHLADYFASLLPEMLNRVRFHSGTNALCLHGWQLGGVLALCCAALSDPADIDRLVLLDTPLDYHAPIPGERRRAVWQRADYWQRHTHLRAGRLPKTLMHVPGWLQARLHQWTDRQLLSAEQERLIYSRAYPGGVVADIVDYLWADNVLAAGKLPMANARSTLAAVRAPVLYLCDRDRPKCSQRCTTRLAESVSSAAITAEWLHADADAGIGGALLSRDIWDRTADWLLE